MKMHLLPPASNFDGCEEANATSLTGDRRPPRLVQLNRLLRSAQDSFAQSLEAPQLPVVFLIGAPRTCTTLMAQLLATAGGLEYISNFVARFFETPAIGALIEQSIGIRDRQWRSSFTSKFGVTWGLQEPHEFGYFWDRWFDLGQPTHYLDEDMLAKVDGSGMRRELASIEAVYERPMVYKNNTWCTPQVKFLSHLIPNSVFVACRRNHLYVAQSLVLGRLANQNNVNEWWSVKPSTYAELAQCSIWEQVAGQAIDFEWEMNAQIDQVSPERVVDVPYEGLCDDPYRYVAAVYQAVGRFGYRLGAPCSLPARFENTNRLRLSTDDWQELQAAITKMSNRRTARLRTGSGKHSAPRLDLDD